MDVFTKLVSRREEIDSKENALDSQHDLPVYHRIQRLLRILISHLTQIDNERKIPFRSLAPIILQFDRTLAPQGKEKRRPLFVWNLLQNDVLNQPNVDREIAQDLVRQMRQSEDLYLRQQAMKYTVPWNEKME